jgi:hypothetical protein
MAFRPMQIPTPQIGTVPPLWEISSISGGVNYEDMEFKLADDQSPDAVNVWFQDRCMRKRWAAVLATTGFTPGALLSAYPYAYKGAFVMADGTNIYKIDVATYAVATLATPSTGLRGYFFLFGGVLYYLDGAKYYKYDGTTCTTVTPYIPTVVINRTPTGGGSPSEDYNRLGAGFRNSFNGNAAATLYQLTDTGLDATAVSVSIGGVVKTEGTHFTVDRTAGTVNFAAGTSPAGAPASGTNNVVITAYKTIAAQISSFMNCTRAIAFGGTNDTRLFFGANGTPYYYWSGLLDPSYVPLSQYNLAGTNDGKVTAFGAQYDRLVIFKDRSIGAVSYQWDTATAKAYFPYDNINSEIGCDMPDTLRLADNNLVWANTYGGVFMLLGTAVYEHMNVQLLSRNINGNTARGGLLDRQNMTGARAWCFDRKYWLAVDGVVYLWDYGVRPYSNSGNPDADAARLSWWFFDGIPAAAWLEDGGNLFYLDTAGLHVFDPNRSPAHAHWKMAVRDFGTPQWRKTVADVYISAFTSSGSQIIPRYYTDLDPNGTDDTSMMTIASVGWDTFTWSGFVWGIINFAKSYRRRPNKKKIVYFAVRISNDTENTDMNITDIKIQYFLDSTVK